MILTIAVLLVHLWVFFKTVSTKFPFGNSISGKGDVTMLFSNGTFEVIDLLIMQYEITNF